MGYDLPGFEGLVGYYDLRLTCVRPQQTVM